MENTMKKDRRKVVCDAACRCERPVSGAHKHVLCARSLLLQSEDVCHV